MTQMDTDKNSSADWHLCLSVSSVNNNGLGGVVSWRNYLIIGGLMSFMRAFQRRVASLCARGGFVVTFLFHLFLSGMKKKHATNLDASGKSGKQGRPGASAMTMPRKRRDQWTMDCGMWKF